MCFNLNEYQFETNKYSYRSTCMNPIVTTNQKLQQTYKNQRERNTSILLKKIMKPQVNKLKEGKDREQLQKTENK